ncbi:Multi-sensor Signal Transduction Histidine Kinase [Nostoc sp. NIES-3756]|uniref:PAS domain S-box protein n=1 Tax=Nostoc sp. NIES-3756 TaxID=1751286 RepID=UPI00072244FF|nr:PAS domain S-box protein [Nostoc sp. NIES-3756]BAT53447.1 Multi-sensor Signal Transduction Histidine Kinase [Nostoc sp. NIES-3756]BAY38815.1 multi-sensor signal transduction histidine kinase [Nostoc sp. NIES-2111]
MKVYRQLLAYGGAIGSTAIALVLSLWLETLIYRTVGAFFYIAIIFNTWYGGLRPGIVTIILSTLAIDYFLITPQYQFIPSDPQDILRLGLFGLVGLIINQLTGNFSKSNQKIQQLNQKLAQENAEQLRMALSAAQMGMWDWDMVSGQINWSPEHERLFGLAFGSFDGRYETFDQCLHPEDRPLLNQALQQALQTHSIYQCEYRIVWADGSIHWIEARGQAFYNKAGEPVRMSGTVMAIDERKQAQDLLQQQFEQQRLVMEMSQRIRRSLNLQDILQTTVDEVRQFLGCDRVILFQFAPDWSGTVVVESVDPHWTAILSTDIYDPCFGETYIQPFKQGLVTAKSDIYTAGIGSCHIELLAKYQVRANLVVPILYRDELWGLLIAHHCAAPREWQSREIALLQQLGEQVSIAIQQAALFEQLQTQLRERQQAEQSLQEREITLRLFVQYAPAGIAMFDRDMRYLIASQRWVDDYRLDSVASVIGRSHYELFPEITERWRQIHQRCLAGAIERCNEDLFMRPDGSQQWIRWETHPWYTTTGEIGGIIIFAEDITERKQAQISLQQLNVELEQRIAERTAQLTQTNDRLIETVIQQQQTQLILLEQAQLLDLAHDSIITRDLNGAIAFWNEGAEYMYGWTKAEALGQITHTLLKTRFPQPLTQIEAELWETGYWEGELIHVRRDARPITVASRWVLQKDNAGRPIKILEINNDITERKQAEAALQQYVHEIEDLYNNAPCGYHSLDAQGNCIRINDTELKWLGYSRDEMLHKNFLDIATSEGKKIFQENFFNFKQQSSINNLEFEILNKDGTTRWVSVNATAIKDENGNFVMSRSSMFDISEKHAALRERKRTEAILRQYEGIVSSTKDGIALLNHNYIYQIVNQAYLDWCNKPDTEVLSYSVRDVLGEILFDNFIQARLDRCLTGETIQYERWFDYPNLVPQFMSVTYTPYLEPEGSISGIIVSLRDLTELKQAEQMLELQAVITRNMAEGVCVVSATDGSIVYANPKFEQMFGYDLGELNGQHVSIVNYATQSVTAEDVNQAIRSAVLQKGESTYEVHNVKKDGTSFWCSATCSVFNHPDYGDVLVAVQQDITDRKRIADNLRESEEKFRQLADNIQAVFWMTDIQNQQVLYVSKAYETVWQKSSENIYQNFSDWLDSIHPDDRQLLDIAFTQQSQTGQSDTKYRIIRPDGSMRWIRDRAFPIKNEMGEIVRIAGIAEDITEQQKIEQIKTEFISIVSHELRTPLTAIRASLGLLNSGIYDKKPDKFKRMIEIAAIDSDRLVRLVNDILDLERLESGRAVLDKTTCKAADLITQAVEGVNAIAKQQNITFNIHPTNAQVWVAADTIIQTLTNLLGNAIKFSPPDSTITLIAQQQTDYVLFQVTDQGRGIPTDKLEAIFGRFQQVDATDSRVKGGTGLGLAICRTIIEQHGGQIWAESKIDVGSTFFFTLPNTKE